MPHEERVAELEKEVKSLREQLKEVSGSASYWQKEAEAANKRVVEERERKIGARIEKEELDAKIDRFFGDNQGRYFGDDD